MPEVKLNVVLLAHTPDPEGTIAVAGRLCYSPVGVSELKGKLSTKEKQRLLNLLLAGGHHSPLEHATFTFGIEGISRACSHQLVRHRIASYSQQSQRYVSAESFNYVVPPQIARTKELKKGFVKDMENLAKRYGDYRKALLDKGRGKEQAQEDARFILPNAAETKIVVTMNARELIHAGNYRLCTRAQWEIRRLFKAMKKNVEEVAPTIATYMVSKCDDRILGYCPEGTLSCGNKKTKEQLIKGDKLS